MLRLSHSFRTTPAGLLLPLLLTLAQTSPAHAEVHTLTLRQAVEQALRQNPDVLLAHLDEQKAQQQVNVVREPFSTRLDVGSGLAYTNGFPLSSDSGSPSVIQARASQFLYNRRQRFLVAESQENARGATFASGTRHDDAAYHTASLYLDLQRASQLSGLLQSEVESLRKSAGATESRVVEGRDLPLSARKANLEILKANQRLEALRQDQDYLERNLAIVLGYSSSDRVRVADPAPQKLETPGNEDEALTSAYEANKELRRLDSALIAKGLSAKAEMAVRYPRIDLIAQYALFAKFNNYAQYYKTFQYNNGELGVSIQVPLLTGSGAKALAAQANADAAALKIQITSQRNKIALDVHQGYQEIQRAEAVNEIAKADLDLARESLSVVLAQMEEGRAQLQQVELARLVEQEKWIAFYDAQYGVERAQVNLLKSTGGLMAALR